jgi:hypothetical protein
LHYLKRCRKLTHLNLKYNPVTTEHTQEYYKLIKENVPLIEELDDEPVEEGFFETKSKLKSPKKAEDYLNLSMSQKFLSFGLSSEIMQVLNTSQINQICQEPSEEVLLVQFIKS